MTSQLPPLDINTIVEELNRDPLSKALLERAQYAVLARILQQRLAERDDELVRLRAGSTDPAG